MPASQVPPSPTEESDWLDNPISLIPLCDHCLRPSLEDVWVKLADGTRLPACNGELINLSGTRSKPAGCYSFFENNKELPDAKRKIKKFINPPCGSCNSAEAGSYIYLVNKEGDKGKCCEGKSIHASPVSDLSKLASACGDAVIPVSPAPTALPLPSNSRNGPKSMVRGRRSAVVSVFNFELWDHGELADRGGCAMQLYYPIRCSTCQEPDDLSLEAEQPRSASRTQIVCKGKSR